MKAPSFLRLLGPGLLIAATGVGAGDLAGGAFAGSKLGVAVLWAVALGAAIKFVLTEGLSRWQLATGQTLLEGAIAHLGPVFRYGFLAYLIIWSYVVGSALVSACAVGASALFPDLWGEHARLAWGVLHSSVAAAFIWWGSYKRFEALMSATVAIMFVTVIGVVLWSGPAWGEIMRGFFVPTIPDYQTPDGSAQGVAWTLGLMGGVGGTLTILCYGYWIRERGRTSLADLRVMRIDLGVAYALTALFGMCVVILAAGIDLEGRGAWLVVALAEALEAKAGAGAKWVFLIGGWAALFSSLLGVWQAAPYLFADALRPKYDAAPINVKGWPYRTFLLALAIGSLAGLFFRFEAVIRLNVVFGAFVMPLLAALLLYLNNRFLREARNRWWANLALVATIVFFVYQSVVPMLRSLGR